MSTGSNPAGRFLRLLEAGKKLQPAKNAGEAWAELLGVPLDNKPLLFRRLARVIELPAIIRSRVERIPDINPAPYLLWLPDVEKAFTGMAFDKPRQRFIQSIERATLHGLAVCDEILSRHYPEREIDEGLVQKLRDECQLLFTEVLESDLAPEVRAYILKHLDLIDQALVDSVFQGAEPLEAAIRQTLGSVLFQKSIYKQTQQEPCGRRFWELMGKVAILVKVAEGAAKLIEMAAKALPGG